MNPEDTHNSKPQVDYGRRSVPEVVQEWRPAYDEKWKSWIRECYGRFTSEDEATHRHGVRDFVIILGDSGAPELCALTALYGLSLSKTEAERNSFDSHIRILTVKMGMEFHVNPPPGWGVPPSDYYERDQWHLDRPSWLAWRDHKLQDFAGDRKSAAEASMRLACIHAGVLEGDVGLSFESLCDPLLWHLSVPQSY